VIEIRILFELIISTVEKKAVFRIRSIPILKRLLNSENYFTNEEK